MNPYKLSKVKITKIKEKISAGVSNDKIADEYNIHPSTISYYKKQINPEGHIKENKIFLENLCKLLSNKWFIELTKVCFLHPAPMSRLCEELSLSYDELNSKINQINKNNFHLIKKFQLNTDNRFQLAKSGRRGRIKIYLYVDFFDLFKQLAKFQPGAPVDFDTKMALINNPIFRLNFFLNYNEEYVDCFIPNRYSHDLYSSKRIAKLFGSTKRDDALYTYLTHNYSNPNVIYLLNNLGLQLENNTIPSHIKTLVKKNKKEVQYFLSNISLFDFNELDINEIEAIKIGFYNNTNLFLERAVFPKALTIKSFKKIDKQISTEKTIKKQELNNKIKNYSPL